jgi:DNA-binding response OmpR family regulator
MEVEPPATRRPIRDAGCHAGVREKQTMRVLVAEDHERLAKAVAAGLRRYGMTVDVALDGDDALARLGTNHYDVVVLDRDLPGTHGDEICRTLAAERCESRVLMLTAASSIRDRVEGLGLGADDYLPKPFDFTEMVARVQALSRRPGAPKPEHLGYADLTLNPERRVATRAGRRLALSPKEFAVLECLLIADGSPVSAEDLLERVWDSATDPFTTTVKATINRLRLKLGDPPIIETIRERGYRIGGR